MVRRFGVCPAGGWIYCSARFDDGGSVPRASAYTLCNFGYWQLHDLGSAGGDRNPQPAASFSGCRIGRV